MFEGLASNNYAPALSNSNPDSQYSDYSKLTLSLSEITNRIDFLNAQIEKIEAVTGPSLRTRLFRQEVSELEDQASKITG